ncbi:hypothetical protein ZWY2020_022009 [Hordeum vulgare]|nr:hypothetical protein ZWY2020_022009 [Hordeum vulgare]
MITFTDLSFAGGEEKPRSCRRCSSLACWEHVRRLPGAAAYYFPQGHAKQATAAVDLSVARVPALLPYRISAVRFMADEEVFAKIRLIPISHGDPTVDVAPGPSREGGGRPPQAGLLRQDE